MRILSIDFGTVRIGTALSDELKLFASPYRVLPTTEDAPAEIAAIVRENDVEKVVIGMPYALDGTESDMTRRTRSFALELRAILSCPVVEWDESFSSIKAGERMRGAGVKKRKRQQKGTTDVWAAAIILQEYLESIR